MDVAVYATLPGLTATHNAELQAELARLIAEEATPLQLISSSTKHRVVAAGDATSVISRLDTIFPPNFRESGREHLDKVWPAEGFDFSPATLHVVAALSKRYLGKREQYETLVSEVNFALPVDHSLGLAADAGYVDAIEIGHRLEGLYAAGVLAAGKPDAAIEPLRVMLRVSELLAGENSIVSRSAGAMRRGEALQVLEGIVKHPAATPTLHRQLKMLLDQQLERWPDDATAWIGDRAQGMHTYELIRGGYLLSLLSYDEIREYRDEIGIDKLAALVAENIDQDELFYLRSMRDIVEACSKPHYERAEVFRQIEANLELMRGSSNYPFVADQLLLMQMSQGSRLMALDRARCDAWALALHLACDDEPGNKTTNPLTGDEFFVDIGETQIIVDAIDPDKGQPAAVVPRRVSVGNAPHVGSPIRRGTAARTNR
ncbi:MAG: hypothetical protein H6822_06265 [Planctomycetaceae bacterium]|nr:hypothetical protein [Planctomycetales bacterium]MCB9921765.1 hypothetical protein [Planctomycetaceae bacterium]